jgi:hypothetical protein
MDDTVRVSPRLQRGIPDFTVFDPGYMEPRPFDPDFVALHTGYR